MNEEPERESEQEEQRIEKFKEAEYRKPPKRDDNPPPPMPRSDQESDGESSED